MARETTLILFKPDGIQQGITGAVLDRYLKEGFRIRALKMLQANNELLNEHYAHITHLEFFPDIRAFMQETPVIALALEGEDAISRVRKILGPTDSTEAATETVAVIAMVAAVAATTEAAREPPTGRSPLARGVESECGRFGLQSRHTRRRACTKSGCNSTTASLRHRICPQSYLNATRN